MLQNTTYIQILIGVLLLIIGAIFAGIGTLIRDCYGLRQEKLSTAYAFKGEMEAILQLWETNEYKKMIKKMIKDEETYLQEFKKMNTPPDIVTPKQHAMSYDIRPFTPFFIIADDEVFIIKKTFKNKIGLLNKVSSNIVIFYAYTYSFLTQCEINKKIYNELNNLMNQGNLDEIKEKLIKYYETWNVSNKTENNIKMNRAMLRLMDDIITTGEKTIDELDKFILKHQIIKRIKNHCKSLMEKFLKKMAEAGKKSKPC